MSEVKGLKELLASLKQFPQNIQKNVVRGAIRAGAASLVKEAKANVPVDSGALQLSLRVIKVKAKKPQYIQFKVTAKEKMFTKRFKLKDGTKWSIKGQIDGWYAHMIEFGTLGKRDLVKHPLSPKTKRTPKAKEMAEKGFGIPAHPFMRPAYENKGEETIEVAKTYMAQRLDKEIQKVKK